MSTVEWDRSIEVEGRRHFGKVGDRWLKDMDAEELREWVLRLARELDAEKTAHEETIQLAAGRGCAG